MSRVSAELDLPNTLPGEKQSAAVKMASGRRKGAVRLRGHTRTRKFLHHLRWGLNCQRQHHHLVPTGITKRFRPALSVLP